MSHPNIVEQDTPLPPPHIINNHFHLTPTNIRTLDPAHHRSLLPLSSVEQAFLMLPPICIKTITTTAYATTVKNALTPPPLNYIFAHNTNTLSTTLTVSSSLTNASRSRRWHFPLRKPHPCLPTHSSLSDLHKLSNLCWFSISECIITDPDILQPSQTINTDISTFLLDVCNAEYNKFPSLILTNITTFHQIATVRPSAIQHHELANLYFKGTI